MPRSHPTFHLNIDARDRDEIFTIITRIYAHVCTYERKRRGMERREERQHGSIRASARVSRYPDEIYLSLVRNLH